MRYSKGEAGKRRYRVITMSDRCLTIDEHPAAETAGTQPGFLAGETPGAVMGETLAASPRVELDRTSTALHIIYRSYGGENSKGRPPYYSKLLSLVSMLQAASSVASPVDIIYLNDGHIPADRLAIMHKTGEVIARDRLGCQGSMKASLALASARDWLDNDLVWFAEDDYLYRPDAFANLVEAAAGLKEASYFGLYASIGERAPDGKPQPSLAHVPAGWSHSNLVEVQGHAWRRALSTTSSFAARYAAIRQDRQLMELTMLSGGAWDHTTCLMYQGFVPFSWSALDDHFGRSVSGRAKLRSIAIRTGMNVWQLARLRFGCPRRLLVAPEPALATHLESDHLAIGTDWEALAEQCRVRGQKAGFLVCRSAEPS